MKYYTGLLRLSTNVQCLIDQELVNFPFQQYDCCVWTEILEHVREMLWLHFTESVITLQ